MNQLQQSKKGAQPHIDLSQYTHISRETRENRDGDRFRTLAWNLGRLP